MEAMNAMRCFGIRRDLNRGFVFCGNRPRFLFCKHHIFQPISVLSLVGLCAGLYQDLVRPIFSQFPGRENRERNINTKELEERIQLGYASQLHPDLSPEPSLEAQQIAIKLKDDQSLDLYHSILRDVALGRFDDARKKAETSIREDQINLTKKYIATGRLEAYTGHYEKSADLLAKALTLSGGDFWIASDLVSVQMYRGDYKEAEKLCHELISAEMESADPSYEILARGFSLYGEIAHAQTRYEKARQYFERSIFYWGKISNPDITAFARTINDLGQDYSELGAYEDALPLLERALSLRMGAKYKSVIDITETYNDIGLLKKRQKRYAEAHEFYNKAYRMLWVHFNGHHPAVAEEANNLGSLYFDQEQYIEAEPEYLLALRLWEEFLGPKHPDVARALNNLGTVCQRTERYSLAEDYYYKALAIYSQPELGEHLHRAVTLNNIASVHAAQGKLRIAEAEYRAVYPLMKRLAPPDGDIMRKFLERLALFCENYRCSAELRDALI